MEICLYIYVFIYFDIYIDMQKNIYLSTLNLQL